MGIFGRPQDQVDLDDLKARLAKLEQAVTQLQAQVAVGTGGGAPYGSSPAAAGTAPDWLAEVRALKQRGNKIRAIKVYREHTGLGLKESKDAVDNLI